MSKRVVFLTILSVCIIAVVLFMDSMHGPKTVTIGVIQYTTNNLKTLEGFKEEMRNLGYREGKTIHYLFDGPASTRDEIGPFLHKIVAAKPDLIFASTTPAALAAKEATAETGIPVVFAPVNDPVAAGVITSPMKPEANITGVRLGLSDGIRLQSLKDVAPTITQVFIPYNPNDKSALASLDQIMNAKDKVNVELIAREFTSSINPVEDTSYVPEGVDAMLLPREGLVMSRILQWVEVCNNRGIALSTPRYRQVELGALTGYGFMGYEIGKQAAHMSHKILTGSPVSRVPVEIARDYLFVNMSTAKIIGIDVPDSVLRRAHNIIR